jgi:MYXO-CTERM domain-containing protein
MYHTSNLYRILSAIAILAPFTLHASIVPFANDFEAEAVGDNTAASPSTITGFQGNFPAAIVRDSSVDSPFGSNNQYLQFGGVGVSFFDGTNYSARAIVNGASTSLYTSSVVKMSFSYYQAKAAGWGSHIGVGTGADPWVPDLTGGAGLFALVFDDGVVSLGNNTTLASGSPALPTFTTFTPYRITYYMNWTGESETLTAPGGGTVTLGHKQIAMWMENLNTSTQSETVVLNSSFGALSTHVSMVFRNFNSSSTNQNILYLDNLQVVAVPEPRIVSAVLGMLVLGLVAARRRRA